MILSIVCSVNKFPYELVSSLDIEKGGALSTSFTSVDIVE